MVQPIFATGARIVATVLALEAATPAGAPAAEPVALTFLRRVLQFTDAQIAAVEAREVVTRKLPTADKPEIAAFGVVRVNTDKETFLAKLRDLESFRRGPSTLEIGRLSRPARIEDLRGLSLDDADFEAARECRPGDCDLKLSRSAMERIRGEMDWSAPDARAKAAALMRQMLVQYTDAYMEGGTPAMATYNDSDRPQETPAEFRKLLGPLPTSSSTSPTSIGTWRTTRRGHWPGPRISSTGRRTGSAPSRRSPCTT